jgi:Domain of unknown function (DUF5666)
VIFSGKNAHFLTRENFPSMISSCESREHLRQPHFESDIMKKINRKFLALTTVSLAIGLSLAACGGSSSSDNSPQTVTSTSDTAIGAISGFGSIIVNGVRYDDSAAKVMDDNGTSRSTNSLGIGMMVELKGRVRDDGTGTGSASDITLFSELQGPISNLNIAAGTFTVLGLNVSVSAATAFQDVSGLSALANGNIVEVYGLRSGTNIAASRIEKQSPVAGATVTKLRGQVSAVNTASNTFTVAGVTVNFANAVVTPNAAAIANGSFVKVSSTTSSTGNTLTASRVNVIGARQFALADGAKSEIQGLVSNFVSASQFTVAGVTVNASNATFVRGTAATLANGARIEIKGSVANDVLNARLVKFEDGSGVDEFRLFGVVSNFVSLSNFVVRGVTVDASATGILFERGTAAQIANGSTLEVEGSLLSTANGSILKASKVKFENGISLAPTPTSAVGTEVEFKGTVSSISGDTLVIGTRTIKLSASTVYRKVTRAQLVSGTFVEIKGTTQADGSVAAARVSLED